MKIVSWNANCKFRSKLSEVDGLGWDILVVQECENPHNSKDIEYREWAQNYFWVGGLEYKGLGLFMPVNLEAKLIGQNAMSNKYFITVQLSNGIQLLAVWTQAGSQRNTGYIYQLWEYLKTNEDIGYVITDIDKKYDKDVIKELKGIDETIRFRVLY